MSPSGYIAASGSITGSTGSCTGNAATATRWATGRTIALTGDVTGTSAAFDGSAALSFATTLANSGVIAGTYLKVTVDAKGRVTAGSSMTSGDVTGALGFTPANKAGESFTGSISVTGTITATGDITAYSDASLKTDVATISNALDLVKSLRGVSFTRIETGRRGIGVIAQELAAVVPGAAQAPEDGLLSVAYGNLVGVLIEAMKQQRLIALRPAHDPAEIEADHEDCLAHPDTQRASLLITTGIETGLGLPAGQKRPETFELYRASQNLQRIAVLAQPL